MNDRDEAPRFIGKCEYCGVPVENIEQLRPHQELIHNDESLILTRRQWLTRFQSELAADQPLHDPEHYEYLSKYALAIAERAAGVQA